MPCLYNNDNNANNDQIELNMDKYQNKYRIPSARLQTWDYRWAGAYFITICTAGRKHFFGEIVKTGHTLSPNKMQLSHVGVMFCGFVVFNFYF